MKKRTISLILSVLLGTATVMSATVASAAGDDVLEFYHGYYQDESEWAAAQVMRAIIGCSVMRS